MKSILIIGTLVLLATFGVSPPVLAAETLPRFELGECPIAVPAEVEITCGYLVVPENYNDPQGKAIRMPVLIIHNRDGDPNADAVLFTEGGPGYSSLSSVWAFAGYDISLTHDIVILEQRGNRYAEPSLSCDVSVLWEENPEDTACLDSLIERGIDVTQYNTANIAADIDALRQVLEYPAWNLYGTSYSTRPMQLVLANNPEDIRSVVFNSVVPMTSTRFQHDPEHSARAIRQMLEDCAANAECAAAYPELEDQLFGLITELNDNPVEFELTFSDTDDQFKYQVTGDDLIGWMVGDAFYQPAFDPFPAAYLPLLISEVSAGRTELLYPWAEREFSGLANQDMEWAMYLVLNCQDFAPGHTVENALEHANAYPELDGYFRHLVELEICAAWGLPSSDVMLDEPISTDIPTLVLGGSYDPITPPTWSRTALVNFSNLAFVQFPSAGHSVPNVGQCPNLLITAFLNDPTAELDLSCMEEVRQANFFLPGEIIIAPAVYEMHWGELGTSMLEQNIFLGSLLLQLGSAFVLIIIGLVNLIRRKRTYQRGKAGKIVQPLAVFLAVFALLWSLELRYLLGEVATVSPVLLYFGLPAVTWPIFVGAILIGAGAVTLAVLVGLAWKRGYWGPFTRLLITLSTAAALVFSGMLGYWGLLTALFSLI